MRQLARRLQRLASTGTCVDCYRSVNRLGHEAALEVTLPPATVANTVGLYVQYQEAHPEAL